MSLCRQNYHEECEAGINKQINLELYASYVYLSMVGSLSSLCHFFDSSGLKFMCFFALGLSLRSWWCGPARISQIHAETIGRGTWTRSQGNLMAILKSSKSCVPVVLLIRTITQFVADEIPEWTRRPHCVARCQGKGEKKKSKWSLYYYVSQSLWLIEVSVN